MRRAPGRPRERAPRAVVVGEGTIAIETARRLAASRIAEVRVSQEQVSDALVVCSADPSFVREVALGAARICPWTALILAAREGLALSREAARASGLAPWLILSPGGLPHAAAEASRLARRLDLSASQICVPVIGGDGPEGTRALARYTTVAGIPAADLGAEPPRAWPGGPRVRITEEALVSAAVALARAVLWDRRLVLSCGAWVDGAFGIPGAYVTAPVPVGARGAEEPLPLSLTLEERAYLQAAAGGGAGSVSE
jgi:malate dehydrogenase